MKKQVESEYEKQANGFAQKYGVKLEILSVHNGIMNNWNDNQYRWIFKCRLSRNNKTYTFDFGQSIAAGKEKPTMYDVLTCLTKYDPESFEDFCDNFGYEAYTNRGVNKETNRIYLAVDKEWENVEELFGDILDELREID